MRKWILIITKSYKMYSCIATHALLRATQMLGERNESYPLKLTPKKIDAWRMNPFFFGGQVCLFSGAKLLLVSGRVWTEDRSVFLPKFLWNKRSLACFRLEFIKSSHLWKLSKRVKMRWQHKNMVKTWHKSLFYWLNHNVSSEEVDVLYFGSPTWKVFKTWRMKNR